MAWILARWDTGSQEAFVARVTAAALPPGHDRHPIHRRLRPGLVHRQTILPNALRAGHNLVLALDRALAPPRRAVRFAS